MLRHIAHGLSSLSLLTEFEFNCFAVTWPAALTSLQLAGVESSPASLFSTHSLAALGVFFTAGVFYLPIHDLGLPPSVTHLNLSGSSFCIPNVDFTHQLPNLKTLFLENCKLNYTDEKLWCAFVLFSLSHVWVFWFAAFVFVLFVRFHFRLLSYSFVIGALQGSSRGAGNPLAQGFSGERPTRSVPSA